MFTKYSGYWCTAHETVQKLHQNLQSLEEQNEAGSYIPYFFMHIFFPPTDVYYITEFVFYVAGKCYDKNIDSSQQKIYRGRASLSTRWQHAIWW